MSIQKVAALNGFLGNRVGLDVTDVVNARAKEIGWDYYAIGKRRRPARGGAGPLAKRRFHRWIQNRADGYTHFYFVGKSYGAHWIVEAIQKQIVRAPFHALLFDPACSLRRDEKRVEPLPPGCAAENVTVVRQLGYRSGYQVHGAEDIVLDAKHRNIERTRLGLRILHEWVNEHLPIASPADE